MTTDISQAQLLMGSLIHSTMGTVMYARSLLPKSCFSDAKFRLASGKSVRTKVLLEGSGEKGDRMHSSFSGMLNGVRHGTLGCIKLVIMGTKKVPSATKGIQYVQEVYTIDFDHLLSSANEALRSEAVEDSSISADKGKEELFATVDKLSKIASSFEPFETIDRFFEDGFAPAVEEELKDPVVYDHPVLAPFHRFSQYSGTRCSDEDFESSGNLQITLEEKVGILNNVEDIDAGTVRSSHYNAHVWVRRILSYAPLFGVPPEDVCECESSKDFQFATTKCKLCSRAVHLCCYGIIDKSKANITCYSCIYAAKKRVPPKLTDLMRLRFLWKYFTNYDLPKSFQGIPSMFPKYYADTNLILNTMMRYSVLEVSQTSPYPARVEAKLKGKVGYVKVGSFSVNGELLEASGMLHFSFSPVLDHWKVTGLKYKRETQFLFFPKTVESTMRELEKRCHRIFGDDPVGYYANSFVFCYN